MARQTVASHKCVGLEVNHHIQIVGLMTTRSCMWQWVCGTYVGIDFFGQNADLFGRQLRKQLVDVQFVVLAQVLAVQFGRCGRHGGGLFRRRLQQKHRAGYECRSKNERHGARDETTKTAKRVRRNDPQNGPMDGRR